MARGVKVLRKERQQKTFDELEVGEFFYNNDLAGDLMIKINHEAAFYMEHCVDEDFDDSELVQPVDVEINVF